MSSRALAGVRTAAAAGGLDALTSGERFVLWVLADESDDTGDAFACEASEEDLARVTGAGVSTVRRHLNRLEEAEFIARHRGKNADGTWAGYRTNLSLEKLGVAPIHRSNRAVAGGGVGNPVDNGDAATAQFEQTTAQNERATAQIERSLRKNILPSLPSNFIFADENERATVVRILEACGPGLAGPPVPLRLLESLTQRLPAWLMRWDLEADIIPVIAERTARPRKKPVYDFQLFEGDIAAHRRQRIPPKPKGPPVIDDATRLERLAADRLRVEQGRAPIFVPANDDTQLVLLDRIDQEIAAVEGRIYEARKVKA